MIHSGDRRTQRRGAPCTARMRPGARLARASRPRLSEGQLQSIRAVMRLFVEDDLASGITPDARRYCPGCKRDQSAAGFIQYGERAACNDCATAYEIARVSGEVTSFEGFLRRG